MLFGLSVKRLRWGLLASAVLLVLLLAVFLGYGRYRMLKIAKTIISRAEHHMMENFTYSDSKGGKINYTLHADKVEPPEHGHSGDEVYILHGVTLDIYGRTEGSVDHVYGKDFEFDRTNGNVKALGDVEMDMQAPASVGGQKTAPAQDAASGKPENIHVKTSGLVYVKSLGVAATSERVDFTYGEVQGSAQGAEFDNGRNVLHLLAQVEATGDEHGQPMHLTATKADIDRTSNVATFENAVVTSGDRTGRANHTIAYLRHDSSVERLEGVGGVVLSQGTRQVNSSHLDATFSTASVVQTMKLTGGVTLVDSNAQKPMHGGANVADVTFDAKGSPAKIVATGAANVTEVDHKAAGPAQGLRRSLNSNEITMNFVAGTVPANAPRGTKPKSILHELHAVGGARALGDSWGAAGSQANSAAAKGAPVLKTSQVAADDLLGDFVEDARGEAELKTLHGKGHTQLQQDTSAGAEQVSSGDTLEAVLVTGAPVASGSRVETAVQSGHVIIHSRPAPKAGAKTDVTTATADRANYDGATEKLRLTGSAHVSDGTTEMSAASIVVDQPTGDAEAEGNVVAAVLGNGAGAGQATSAQVTHVMAASGKLQHTSKLAEFRGTDAQPAKMWQGASQVEAANLFLDGEKHTMAARPQANGAVIHAVFAGANAAPKINKPAGNSVVRVTAEKMDYADLQREATFVGKVRMDGLTGNATSQRAVVFLTPAAKNNSGASAPIGVTSGSVDHVVLTGDVQVQQPGRHATGETLLYTASDSRYVLMGTPGHLPKAVDAQQGNVTGATLIFGDAGSTIIVAGEPASPKGKGTRVRTETEVRPEGKK